MSDRTYTKEEIQHISKDISDEALHNLLQYAKGDKATKLLMEQTAKRNARRSRGGKS